MKMTKEQKKRFRGFCLSFAVAFTIGALVTSLYLDNRMKQEYSEMEQLVITRSNKINNVISKLLYKTQVLSSLISQTGGEIMDFDSVASTLVDDPSIRNVILAPGGVVKYVYPFEGNESVIGLDYFSEAEGNVEAIQARDTGKLVLGGPFNLIQGGQAIVGRVPVYIGEDKHFWGIASITLNYPQVLDGAELEQLKQQGYAYEIWRISPDTNQKQIISSSDYEYHKSAQFVETPIDMINAQWYFKLSPIMAWYQFPETWAFIIVTLCISLLIGFLIVHTYDLSVMKKKLEKLSLDDPLTSILNRRGGIQVMESLISRGTSFVLCYLDLNKFKQINDRYGHNVGDMVLKRFTEEFINNMPEEGVSFARVGGDEFMLIFEGIEDVQKTEEVFNNVRKAFENGIVHMGDEIFITFSIGYSVYPTDGGNVDELVALADGKMYEDKHGSR